MYVIIKDGKVCCQIRYTEEEIQEMRKDNKLSDDVKVLCIEEEIEKYHLEASENNQCGLDGTESSFMIWWNAYVDNNLTCCAS